MDKPKPGDWLTASCYVADKIGERLIVIVRGESESAEDTEKRGRAIREERLARRKLVDRQRGNTQ